MGWKRYLKLAKPLLLTLALLPVNAAMAHYNFGIRHKHGTTIHNPTGGTQVTHDTTQGPDTATHSTGGRTRPRTTGGGRQTASSGAPTGYTGDGTPGNPFRPRPSGASRTAGGTPIPGTTPHTTGGTPFSSRSTKTTGGTPARKHVKPGTPKTATDDKPGDTRPGTQTQEESPSVKAARERLRKAQERVDELAERNIGSSAASNALERAQKRLRQTLQRDAQDRAAGRRYYSPGARRERERERTRIQLIDHLSQLGGGEHTNEDGSTTYIGFDNFGNRHVRLYGIADNGGEYLEQTLTIRPDGRVTARDYDRFGNNEVNRSEYGAEQVFGSQLQEVRDHLLAMQNAQVLTPDALDRLQVSLDDLFEDAEARGFDVSAIRNHALVSHARNVVSGYQDAVSEIRTTGQTQAASAGKTLVDEVNNTVAALYDRYGNDPDTLATQLNILAGTGKYDSVVVPRGDWGSTQTLTEHIQSLARQNQVRALPYDPSSEMDPDEGQRTRGGVSLDLLESQYMTAFRNNDLRALADLADSGVGDDLEIETSDGTASTYTDFLRGEIRRLSEFNRMQADGGIDPDQDTGHRASMNTALTYLADKGYGDNRLDSMTDAQVWEAYERETGLRNVREQRAADYQDARLQAATDMQFALDPEGRSVPQLFTGGPIVVDPDTDAVFTGADAYKTSSRAMSLQERANRQGLLSMLPDDIDPDFARNAPIEDLELLVKQQQHVQTQRLFAADPEAGRPSFIGPTITGNQFDRTVEALRQQRLQSIAAAVDADDLADQVERAITDFKPVLVSYDTDLSKTPTTINLDTPWDDDLFRDAVHEHRQNQDLWTKGLNSEEAKNLKSLYGYALMHGKEEEAQQIQGIIERASDHNPREAWRFLATSAPLAFLGGGGLSFTHAAIGAAAGATIAPSFTYALPEGITSAPRGVQEVWSEAMAAATEGDLLNTDTFHRVVDRAVSEGKLKPGEAANLRNALIVGAWEGAGVGAATGGVLASANRFVGSSIPKAVQSKTPQWVKGPGNKYVLRPNQEALLETGLVDTGLDYIGGDAPTLQRFWENYLQNFAGDRLWSAYSGTPGALKETATFAGRTFGPGEVQFTLPGWGEVTIEGPGGFHKLATPAPRVPWLFTDRGTDQSAVAHQVYQQIAETGSFKGIIDGQVVEFESGPMAEAFMKANPGQPIYYHASPNIQRLIDSPEVLPKAGMSQQEQYVFFSVEPVSKFEEASAYGEKGPAPGMLAATSPDVELGYVLDDKGDIKYYKKGYEGEQGTPTWEPLSESEVRALASPRGDLWTTESIKEPGYWDRVVANLEGLGEAATFQPGGRFEVRTATEKDYAELPNLTASARQQETALDNQQVRWVTRLRDRIDVLEAQPEKTTQQEVNLEKMKNTLAEWQRMWGVTPLPRGSQLPGTPMADSQPFAPPSEPAPGQPEPAISTQDRENILAEIAQLQEHLAQLERVGAGSFVKDRLNQRIQALQSQVGQVTTRIAEVPGEVRQRVDSARDRLIQEATELQGQVAALMDRADDLPANVRNRLTQEVRELQEQLADWRDQGQEMPSNVRETLTERKEALQDQVNQLTARVGQVPGQVRQRIDDAGDRLLQEVGQLRDKLTGLPEGVLRRVIEARIAGLEQRLADSPEIRLDQTTRAIDTRPAGVRREEPRPEEEEGRPSYPEGIDIRPEDLRPEDLRSEDIRPDDVRPDEVRPEDFRPEDFRPEDLRPEDLRPEELRSEDIRPDDVRPEELRSEDIRPEDLRPEDLRPEELRSEDIRPDDVRPGEVRPEDFRPEDFRPEDLRPEEVRPEDVRPEDTRPDDVRPDDVRPGEVRPGDIRPEDLRPDEVRPEDLRPGEIRPEDIRPDEVRPEDVRPEEIRPEDIRPDEVRPVDVRPVDVRPEDGSPTTKTTKRVRPRDNEEESEQPFRQLTTDQEYPEVVEWDTYDVNILDPQTGELRTEPLDNTEIDSLSIIGKTEERPQAGQAKLGNITFSNDFEGQLAEQVDSRTRDVEEEAAYDATLASDPTSRQQLTGEGRYPDIILWLARNRKRWDPQTGEYTSEMVDDTALKTLQVHGETDEPPATADVRAGNLSIKSDQQGASVEGVPKRELSLPVSGLPSAEDAPVAGKSGKKPRYGRRGGKRKKNQEEILTEMTGQSGVVEAPVIFVR